MTMAPYSLENTMLLRQQRVVNSNLVPHNRSRAWFGYAVFSVFSLALMSTECRALNASIGILVPLHWEGGPVPIWTIRWAASAMMAVYHINHRVSSLVPDARELLPENFKLVVDMQDSEALTTVAISRAVEWNRQGRHAIVGSYRSAVTGPMALVASIEATPVIAYGSTASTLSDRSTYRTLSRSIINDAVLARRTIDMISSMGWTRAALLYVDDAWGRAFVQDALASAWAVGVEIATQALFPIGDKAEMEVAVQQVKASGSRITICLVFDSDLAALAALAHRYGLLESGYTAIGIINDVIGVLNASPDPAATQQHLTGWLFVRLNPFFGDVAQRFQSVLNDEPLAHLNNSLLAGFLSEDAIAGVPCDQYCGTIYDAVWTAAIAISSIEVGDDGSVDKAALLNAIRHVSFEGATGRVQYDHKTGERDPAGTPLRVENLQPETGPNGQPTLSRVLKWQLDFESGRAASKGVLKRMSSEPPLWPGGERAWEMPVRVLECGPGFVFSTSSLQCEACRKGTEKEGNKCVQYNASLGVLVPLHWGSPSMNPNGLRYTASTMMAVYHINHRVSSLVPDARQLLPENFKLVIDMQDSEGLPSVAVHHAVEWNRQGRHAIVGSYRSAVTGPVALAASIEATPVISYGSTASSLSDRVTYPMFSRSVINDAVLAQNTVDMIRSMGWTRIAILHVNDAWGRSFAQEAGQAARDVGMDVAVSHDFTLGDQEEMEAAVNRVSGSGSRITICAVFDSDLAALAALAHRYGLLESGYTAIGIINDVIGVLNASPDPAATQQHLTGWLFVRLNPFFGDVAQRFQSVLNDEPLAHLNNSLLAGFLSEDAIAGVPCDQYCGTIYDAVWTAAIAISSIEVGDDGSVDKAALLNAIRHVSFEGATGRVQYDHKTGERDPAGTPLRVENLQPETGPNGQPTLSSVLKWQLESGPGGASKGVLKRMSSEPPLWPGGERAWEMPVRVLECGPGFVFSSSVLQCEACRKGTEKKGNKCVQYNASLGVLVPLHWGGPDKPMKEWAVRVAYAAAMAAYHINHRVSSLVPDARQLLPENFKLVVDMQDSEALLSSAVTHAVAWGVKETHAIVGSYRSAVTGPVALAASIEATPVISWGSTASFLSDSESYPALSRTIATDAVLAEGIVMAVRDLGWTRIGILHVDDAWGRGFAQDASSAADSTGIEVIMVKFASGSRALIEKALQQMAGSGARVMLCVALGADIASIGAAADKLGLLASHAWLVPHESISSEVVSESPDPEATLRHLTGWLAYSIEMFDGEHFQQVLESELQSVDRLSESAIEASIFDVAAPEAMAAVASGPCGQFCTTIYDAIWTAAVAISRVGTDDDGSVNKRELLAAVRAVSFDGASGRVQFTENGDREVIGQPLVLHNLKPLAAKAGGQASLALELAWRWLAPARRNAEAAGGGGGRLLRASLQPPIWPGGNVSWNPPPDGTCSPGLIFSKEGLVCVACGRGTRQVGNGCRECEAGSIGAEEGGTDCAKCQQGYASAAGMTACTPCPLFSARPDRSPAVSVDECLCIPGYFRADVESETGHGFECRPCPTGLVCEGRGVAPYPAEGWWSGERDNSSAFKCAREAWCPGKTECAQGHSGVGCGVCTGGRAMDLGGCVECETESGERKPANYIGVIVMCFVVALLWYFFALKPLIASDAALTDTKADTKIMGMVFSFFTIPFSGLARTLYRLSKELTVQFKIIVSFLQVLGSLLSFSVDWPATFRFMVRWASILNLDFLVLPGAACMLGGMSFHHRLLIQTLIPIAALLFLGLPVLFVNVAGLLAGNRRGHPRYSAVTSRFIQSSNIIIFLAYPSVSAFIFSAFQCQDFGADGSFLRADFRVDCASPEYHHIMWYAIAFVLVYPIGVPAYMYAMMRVHGVGSLARDKMAHARFQGLLVLRKRQTSTKMRAMLACRFGHTTDKAEFERRVNALHTMGRSGSQVNTPLHASTAEARANAESFHLRHQESWRNGEAELRLEEGNLDWHELQVAIGGLLEVAPEELDAEEVKALLDKYDPNKDGLSQEEMTMMLHDVVEQHCQFTDHEELRKLSIAQLRSLRHHDWTLPSDNPTESLLTLDEQQEQEEGDERDQAGRQTDALRSELSFLRKEGLPVRKGEREELMAWVQDKARELNGKGLLPQHPTVWRQESDEERKAIQRLGFLFLSYQVSAWWFELVLLGYKLLMTAVLVLLFEGSPAQISLAFLLTMLLLTIVLRIQPLVNRKLFNLQVLSLLVQALNCFFGVMLKAGALRAEESTVSTSTDGRAQEAQSVSVTSLVLVALNILVPLLPFLQVITDYRMLKLRYKSTMGKMEAMNRHHDHGREAGSGSKAPSPAHNLKAGVALSSEFQFQDPGSPAKALEIQPHRPSAAVRSHDEAVSQPGRAPEGASGPGCMDSGTNPSHDILVDMTRSTGNAALARASLSYAPSAGAESMDSGAGVAPGSSPGPRTNSEPHRVTGNLSGPAMPSTNSNAAFESPPDAPGPPLACSPLLLAALPALPVTGRLAREDLQTSPRV